MGTLNDRRQISLRYGSEVSQDMLFVPNSIDKLAKMQCILY